MRLHTCDEIIHSSYSFSSAHFFCILYLIFSGPCCAEIGNYFKLKNTLSCLEMLPLHSLKRVECGRHLRPQTGLKDRRREDSHSSLRTFREESRNSQDNICIIFKNWMPEMRISTIRKISSHLGISAQP